MSTVTGNKEHVLETAPDYWEAVRDGRKPFEVRRDDRGFQRGDILVLRKLERPTWGSTSIYCECVDGNYTELRRRISYVLTGGQFGIEPGYVVLGLERDDTATIKGGTE